MSDLISRQAAVDFKVSHGINEDGVLYVPYGEVKKYLEQLPSAQPEDCDTCKHGYFGNKQCANCSVRFPSHYERRTDG